MKKNILLTAAALLTTLAGAAQWQPAGDRIGTEWGEKLDPQNVLPEYPRPQMTRTQVQDGWQNLNGLWNYAILPMGETPEKYDGQILVPFAVESSLSGATGTNSGTTAPSRSPRNGTANACCCTSAQWTGKPTFG